MTNESQENSAPKRVTIRDVARASGTSISTVSVALSGRPGVSETTRARVFEVANKLGWRPDRRASNLRRQDVRQVGVVYEVESVFQARLVDALYVAAEESDLQLVLAAATEHHDERKCVKAMLQERCQTLVLAGSGLTNAEILQIGRNLPTLSLCRYVNEAGVDTVVSDDENGFAAIINHLVSLGHKNILHLDGGPANLPGERRTAAYEKAMRSFGLDSHIQVIPGGTTIADGARVAERVLAMDPLPTAVCCYNDALGSSLTRALRAAGITVPGEISVVGYDDGPDAADPSTSLTTVEQTRFPLARVTMELMNRRINSGVITAIGEEELAVLPTSLVIRKSTGPARK